MTWNGFPWRVTDVSGKVDALSHLSSRPEIWILHFGSAGRSVHHSVRNRFKAPKTQTVPAWQKRNVVSDARQRSKDGSIAKVIEQNYMCFYVFLARGKCLKWNGKGSG